MLTPRRILVHSTKYDGSLHNRYEADLVAVDDGLLTIHAAAGTPIDGYRGPGELTIPFTGLFYTGRWYNIYKNHVPTRGRGIVTYANVATPAVLDGDTLRWVDLDLDVILTSAGEVILDDEDEFAHHSGLWAYPEDLVETARATAAELVALAHRRHPPFGSD